MTTGAEDMAAWRAPALGLLPAVDNACATARGSVRTSAGAPAELSTVEDGCADEHATARRPGMPLPQWRPPHLQSCPFLLASRPWTFLRFAESVGTTAHRRTTTNNRRNAVVMAAPLPADVRGPDTSKHTPPSKIIVFLENLI